MKMSYLPAYILYKMCVPGTCRCQKRVPLGLEFEGGSEQSCGC